MSLFHPEEQGIRAAISGTEARVLPFPTENVGSIKMACVHINFSLAWRKYTLPMSYSCWTLIEWRLGVCVQSSSSWGFRGNGSVRLPRSPRNCGATVPGTGQTSSSRTPCLQLPPGPESRRVGVCPCTGPLPECPLCEDTENMLGYVRCPSVSVLGAREAERVRDTRKDQT